MPRRGSAKHYQSKTGGRRRLEEGRQIGGISCRDQQPPEGGARALKKEPTNTTVGDKRSVLEGNKPALRLGMGGIIEYDQEGEGGI